MELVRSITHLLVENGSQITAQRAIISAYETLTTFVLSTGRCARGPDAASDGKNCGRDERRSGKIRGPCDCDAEGLGRRSAIGAARSAARRARHPFSRRPQVRWPRLQIRRRTFP